MDYDYTLLKVAFWWFFLIGFAAETDIPEKKILHLCTKLKSTCRERIGREYVLFCSYFRAAWVPRYDRFFF